MEQNKVKIKVKNNEKQRVYQKENKQVTWIRLYPGVIDCGVTY